MPKILSIRIFSDSHAFSPHQVRSRWRSESFSPGFIWRIMSHRPSQLEKTRLFLTCRPRTPVVPFNFSIVDNGGNVGRLLSLGVRGIGLAALTCSGGDDATKTDASVSAEIVTVCRALRDRRKTPMSPTRWWWPFRACFLQTFSDFADSMAPHVRAQAAKSKAISGRTSWPRTCRALRACFGQSPPGTSRRPSTNRCSAS